MDDAQLIRLLNETRDEIARAETKASITLAAASLISGSAFAELINRFATLVVAAKVSMIACFAAVLLGMFFLGRTLMPNLVANPDGHRTLAYFGHVVQCGSVDEFERLVTEPHDEHERLTNQIWTLSFLTMRKYHFIRSAFAALGGAICLGVLTMLIQAIAG